MESKKIIIGLVGEAGSGKDTAADYIKEKFGVPSFRFSDPLREALEIFLDHDKVSREDIIWISNNIRKKYGNNIISDALRKKIDAAKAKMVLVNGMRIKEDI